MLEKVYNKYCFFKSLPKNDLKLLTAISLLIVIRVITVEKLEIEDGSMIRVSGGVTSIVYFEKDKRVVINQLKIYFPSTKDIFLGDYLIVEGRLEKGTVADPQIIYRKENRNILTVFRKKLLSFYARTLSPDVAGVVSGMVLGSKELISWNLWQKFIHTGTAHIVVASGTNISFIAKYSLAVLFLYINRQKAVVFVFVFIWLYALMTGFDAPIVRASLMASFAFLAEAKGRNVNGLRIFFLTVSVMLLFKPEWISDISFWLSFSSTLGLLVLENPIREYLKHLPGLFRESLSTSIASFIAVFPISYYIFSYINIAAPFINALILFTVPFITIVGFVSAVVGILIFPLGKLMVLLVYPLTAWLLAVINIFSNV